MYFLLGICLILILVIPLAGYAAASWADATATPSPDVVPTCPQTPTNRLIVAERGYVSDEDPRPVNVRQGPGTSYPILGHMRSNSIFYVLEGPRCSQNYSWYRVEYHDDDGGLEVGWAAEGDMTSYYIEPYFPG